MNIQRALGIKLISILLIVFCMFHIAEGAIHKVGPFETYASPNDPYKASQNGMVVIADGDTIQIEVELYEGEACLAVWMADDLLIQGVNGRPHMKADGNYIWGKGIWVMDGNNCVVENIEFSEAAVPDNNGAGIRLDGNGLTVRQCYFHHNQDGILTNNTNAGDILIEHSEFSYNGAGDGLSHNIYVGRNNKFTMRYCYMHHCNIGNVIKTRADTNIVMYNRIMDEAEGNSSMLLDIPNGGFSIVQGNVFHQGENAENGRSVSFGTEGTNPVMELYLNHNTFVNERFNGRLLDISLTTTIARLTNSIVVNYNVLNEGMGLLDTSQILLADNAVEIFLKEELYAFYPRPQSPAINKAVDQSPVGGYNLYPDIEYMHPHNYQVKQIEGPLDLGAFELPNLLNADDTNSEPELFVYPNPTTGLIYVKGGIDMPYTIYDLKGKTVHFGQINGGPIDVSTVENGLYVLKFRIGGRWFLKKIHLQQ